MTAKTNRIIFLDILRAFAVFMMIQGHTIHTLLANEYRDLNYPLYSFWNTMRGFTAPIFMFSAGTAFTFLLFKNAVPFKGNPRVRKGINRFIVLLLTGYLLRYPTYRIFDFRYVTEESWKIFYSVDALHLIAFGLLFILTMAFTAEKLKLNFLFISGFSTLLVISAAPSILNFNWLDIFPIPIANYFTTDFGSIFPFFPWLGYVFAGGFLGYLLAAKPGIQRRNSFCFVISSLGIILIILSAASDKFIWDPDSTRINLSFYRLGFVLLLSGLISYISLFINNIPHFIKLLGRHSFGIYIVHLIILYGSAWMPGMWKFYGESFSLTLTLVSVIIMISLMTILAISFEKYGNKPKQFLKKIFID